MKLNNKFYKLVGLLLLNIFFLTSCNNDESIDVSGSFDSNGLKVITYDNGNGKSGGTPIAVFTNQEVYNNYINDLDAQVNTWDDAFVAQWNHLDDDALNDKEEALGFDSEKPLTDFENQMGLPSLRKKYLAEEEIWLNNEVLNDALDPNNKSIYDFDETEMAVLNNLAEVQIGTNIYKQLSADQINAINTAIKSGSVEKKNLKIIQNNASITIADGDYITLADFNNGNVSVISNNNVTVVQNSNATFPCKSRVSVKKYVRYTSNKRVQLKVRYRTFAGTYSKAKAKIISYKKRRRWKRYRTNLGVAVSTGVFCERSFFHDTSVKRKRRRKLKRTFIRFFPRAVRAQSNGESVAGRFEYGGKTTIYRLAW